jgi:hypothetical protein
MASESALDDESIGEADGNGQDDSAEQFHKHDELHREAERPAEVLFALHIRRL